MRRSNLATEEPTSFSFYFGRASPSKNASISTNSSFFEFNPLEAHRNPFIRAIASSFDQNWCESQNRIPIEKSNTLPFKKLSGSKKKGKSLSSVILPEKRGKKKRSEKPSGSHEDQSQLKSQYFSLQNKPIPSSSFKKAKESRYVVIRYSSLRRSESYFKYFYEESDVIRYKKEELRSKTIANKQSQDDDCDTDEEQVNAAKRTIQEELFMGLREAARSGLKKAAMLGIKRSSSYSALPPVIGRRNK